MDKPAYARNAVAQIGEIANLTVVAGRVDDIVTDAGSVRGVVTSDGGRFAPNALFWLPARS